MNKQALDQSVDYIKSWLEFRFQREEVPGIVVAVSYKGKLLMNEAYGYADLEKQTKLTPQHIFRIASHSKTFTATALMQLQEQGKLRIDDYVVDYIPWLKEHSDTKWQKVTLRQLMSHGAGVIRDGLNADYWQLERPFPSEAELQREILEANLVIDNNTKLKYSNFGYSLLGLVVAAVSGASYNDYVTQHIVNTLNLKNTGPEYTPAIENKIVTGYSRRDVNKTRLPIAQIDTRAMSAATGFYATAEDLCAYFTAHFVGSGALLDDESKKEMQRVQWHANMPGQDSHVDYGLGLELEYLKKRKTFGHGGGFPGQITNTIADPKDELVVVVLTNCLNSPASTITKSVFGIIDYYQTNTPDTAPKHDMRAFEGRYMNLWGITDIIATGDKVVATYPDTWHALTDPETLEFVSDATFKTIDIGSFDAEDELVHFHLKDGAVTSVNYSGSTMWPEKVWVDTQRNQKIIG